MRYTIIKNKKVITIPALMVFFLIISSCNKQDNYLNVKRENTDVVPTTLQDFQAILDNNNVMNAYFPTIALGGTDNVYLPDNIIGSASQTERNSYIWATDIYQGSDAYDWESTYEMVEYNNIVLDGLAKIIKTPDNLVLYNNIQGSALFYRAIAFYYLAQLYCKPYTASSANTDLGIPIRLSSDVNIPSTRATVQATYDQITNDLKTAITLLPSKPLFTTRPSQVSATAFLAKVYLSMEDYNNAGIYANNSLSMYNTLLDFNNTTLVSTTSTYRFPNFAVGNPEVLFYATGNGYPTFEANGKGDVDNNLYNSYVTNDLRKTLFFKINTAGLPSYYGGYTANHYDFTGVATDEVYLIRSECYARSGNISAALNDLNTLLIKRWKTGTFIPFTASNSANALTQILTERRKELPFNGLLRWEDLRRLNKDPNYAVTIIHTYAGTTYTLSPNDNKYVYPIPAIDVQQYGLQQNPR